MYFVIHYKFFCVVSLNILKIHTLLHVAVVYSFTFCILFHLKNILLFINPLDGYLYFFIILCCNKNVAINILVYVRLWGCVCVCLYFCWFYTKTEIIQSQGVYKRFSVMVNTARDLSNFSQHGMIHFGEYYDIHGICNSQCTLSYILVLHVIFRNLTTIYVFLASPLYIMIITFIIYIYIASLMRQCYTPCFLAQ